VLKERDVLSISIPVHGWMQVAPGSFSCEITRNVNLLLGPLSYTIILTSADIVETVNGRNKKCDAIGIDRKELSVLMYALTVLHTCVCEPQSFRWLAKKT
jgi:hypothetical protein